MEKPKDIAANRIPLTHRMKSLKDSLYLRSHKPHTEEASEIEEHSVEHSGNIIGNVKTRDGKIVEHQASADMQETGKDEEIAKKTGGKDAIPVKTVASRAAEQSSKTDQVKPKETKDNPTANGSREPQKVELIASSSKETSKDKAFKDGKSEAASLFKPAKSGSGMKPAEGDFKAEKSSSFDIDDSQSTGSKKESAKSGKTDNSMSKMASQKSADTQGSELFKSNPPSPKYKTTSLPGGGSSHGKQPEEKDFEINTPSANAEPYVLDYSKHAPPVEIPRWKQRMNAMSPEDKADLSMRMTRRKGQQIAEEKARIKQKPGMKKALDDGYKVGAMAADIEQGGSVGGWKNLFSALKKNAECIAQPMIKASPPSAGTGFKAPAPIAIAKPGEKDKKKQDLMQMARTGQPKPLTSTPLGHAYSNYTDPNSFSFDPKFAALIQRMAPTWAKK